MVDVSSYDLFLFDFDGLLVDTESLHFAAYRAVLKRRGFSLNWDFPRYTQAAHHTPTGISEQIYAEFPKLIEIEPNWEKLYKEKKEEYLRLVADKQARLMPGVESFINKLVDQGRKMCVVTHSPKEQIDAITAQIPVLEQIKVWLTREDYKAPKPDPECYLKAIALCQGEKVIGFEDTPRGLHALMGTPALPVLVGSTPYPSLASTASESYLHIPTFDSLHI